MRKYRLSANEPVRLGFLIVGTLLGLSTFLLAWGAGQDWRLALGAALGEIVASLLAGEAVSAQTVGPKTFGEVVDAEAVISAAERGEHRG